MNENSSIQVECYSGHTYAQEPRSFVVGDKQRIAKRVCKRWREPTGPCFEILADDGVIYLLKYEEAVDKWHVSTRCE